MPTYIDRSKNALVQTGKTEHGIKAGWIGYYGIKASSGWSSSVIPYNRRVDDEAAILQRMDVRLEDLNKISELPETFPATVGLVAVCEITDELLKQAGILA